MMNWTGRSLRCPCASWRSSPKTSVWSGSLQWRFPAKQPKGSLRKNDENASFIYFKSRTSSAAVQSFDSKHCRTTQTNHWVMLLWKSRTPHYGSASNRESLRSEAAGNYCPDWTGASARRLQPKSKNSPPFGNFLGLITGFCGSVF